jgi:hypothetical protein
MKPKAFMPRKFTEVVAMQVNVSKDSFSDIEEIFYFVYGKKWKSIENKGALIKEYLRNLFCHNLYTFKNVYKETHASYWENQYISLEVHDLDYIVKPEIHSDPSLIEIYDEKTFNSIFREK